MSTSTQTFEKDPALMPISYKEHSTTMVGEGQGQPGYVWCVCVCVCVCRSHSSKLHLEAGNFFPLRKNGLRILQVFEKLTYNNELGFILSGSRRQVIAPGECYRQVGLSSRTVPKAQRLPREV